MQENAIVGKEVKHFEGPLCLPDHNGKYIQTSLPQQSIGKVHSVISERGKKQLTEQTDENNSISRIKTTLMIPT